MKRTFRLEGISVVDPSSAPPSTGPKWCRLFPGHTVRHREDFPREGIAFDDSFFDSVIAGWTSLGKQRLPVDYAHDEAGIAAGWIVDMRKDVAGNLEVAIEWCARARAAIIADELAFLSPTFALEYASPLTGQNIGPTLFGAALLNTPFLHDLPRVTAGRKGTAMEFLKKVCAMFGLADDMSEEECLTAASEKLKAMRPADEPAVDPWDNADVQAKHASAVAAAVDALRVELGSKVDALEKKGAALEAEKIEAARKISVLEAERVSHGIDELVRVSLSRGVADARGRVEKAIRLGGNLESAREIMALVEPTVQLGELGHGSDEDVPETRQGAFDKLKLAAEAISKAEGVKEGRAFELAVIRNPKLAAATRGQ